MNRTLTLLRYASLEGKGWRRGAAVITKNGKLKPNAIIIGGNEWDAPNGRFQMRRYEGTRAVYTDLGNDPTDVLNRFRSEEATLNARASAIAAGLEIVSPDKARKSLKQHASFFLAMHRSLPHRSDDSVRVYTQVTSSFVTCVKAAYPEDVTKEDVIRWHGWMRDVKKYSDRTCSDRYMSLRGFLRYCGLMPGELIPKGAHKMLKSYTKRTVNTYTPEVVAQLIKASTDDNRELLWDFAYKTGLRDSELRMVTRHDLHGLDSDSPTLHVKERDDYGRLKTGKERIIELHLSLVPNLKAWLKDNPTNILVFGTKTDKPDTKMLKALKVTARRAGLNCGRCSGCGGKHNYCGEFTLHRFRRTFCTRMLRATKGDIRSVMERSGHVDLASIMRYLEPAAQIREAFAIAF